MTELKLTTEEQARVRLIADYTLYAEARKFIADHNSVDGQKQMSGLIEFSRSWDELLRYVARQRERNWTGRTEYYKSFYIELERYLKRLPERVKTEFGLAPAGLPAAAEKQRIAALSQALSQAFVQYLAAENLWQEKIR